MEHKKRKMFAAVMVMMLCAVAIVGVGYAYTATTTNNGNNVSSEYITLSQSGTGEYNFTGVKTMVYYDTENYKEGGDVKTKYYLTEDTFYDSPISGATVVHLGNQFTVNASSKGIDTKVPLTCNVTTDNFAYTEGWKLYIVADDGTNSATILTQTGANTWDSSSFTIPVSGNAYVPVKIDVYYGYVDGTGTSGTLSVPSDNPLVDASIKFKVSNTTQNQGVVLDKNEVSIAASGTTTITATVHNVAGKTVTDVQWSITGIGASISGSSTGASVVVTAGAGAGSATLTATVTDSDGVVFTATCAITVTA